MRVSLIGVSHFGGSPPHFFTFSLFSLFHYLGYFQGHSVRPSVRSGCCRPEARELSFFDTPLAARLPAAAVHLRSLWAVLRE